MDLKTSLSDNLGNLSSMRVNNRVLVIAFVIILLAVAFHIVYNTLEQRQIEWAILGVFVGAVATALGTLLYMQKEQKKIELDAGNAKTSRSRTETITTQNNEILTK